MRFLAARLAEAAIILAVGAPRCAEAQEGIDFSADAKLVAYSLNDTVWLSSTSTAAPAKRVAQGGMPHFSPTGDRLAFYSSASGSRQLWVFDVRTSRLGPVTRVPGGINVDVRTRFSGWIFDPLQYAWSPDGTRLVFTALAPARAPSAATHGSVSESDWTPRGTSARGAPLVLTTDTPAEWTLLGVFRRDVTVSLVGSKTADMRPIVDQPRQAKASHLFIANLLEGRTTLLTSDDGGYFNPDWSPDGTQIVAAAAGGRSLDGWGGPEDSDLCLFDLASRNRSCLGTGPGQKRLPRWSPDGKAIAYLGGPRFGPSSVYVVEPAGGASMNATARLDRDVSGFDWGPTRNSLFVAYRDGLETPIARIDVRSGAYARVESGNVWPLGFGRFVERLPAWRQWPDGNSASRIRALGAIDSLPYTVVDLKDMDPLLLTIRQDIVEWRNSRGHELQGLILRPREAPSSPLPLLVNAYSGFTNVPSYHDEMRLAQEGFVVFLPNHRSPHMWMNLMKNAAYDAATSGAEAIDLLQDDVLSGIDTLIARGLIDSTRMCVYGQSNGGLSALYLLMRMHRFTCASVSAPSTPDWPGSFFLDNPDGTAKYLHGATPWSDPALYVALSPVYHADEVNIPLLLSVGDNDHERLLATVGLYNALRYLGRPVTLLRYAGQGHQLIGAARDDFMRRQVKFFRRYLTSGR